LRTESLFSDVKNFMQSIKLARNSIK